MSVPYLGNVLNGWLKKETVTFIIKTTVNFQTVETETTLTAKLNKQPLKPQLVNRKPEDQRQWKWWNIIIKNGPLLKIDDQLTINDIKYTIQQVANWSDSGFQKYEAVENYGN